MLTKIFLFLPIIKNFFSIEEFEVFVERIFKLLNQISSSIFYEGYAFFNHSHPDIEQSLNMINEYRKHKKEINAFFRKGITPKKIKLNDKSAIATNPFGIR